MALTYSTMLALGVEAPDFRLTDVISGRTVALADFADRNALLVMFICRHCPYVRHVLPELAKYARDYAGRGVGIVGICSNDVVSHPADAPQSLKEMAAEAGLAFPILQDERQDVAKAYHAACTPDFFLFDATRRLVYRGQLDDSRPKTEIPLTGRDLRDATDATLAGRPAAAAQRPSIGCSIKWKDGNAPPYVQA